MPGIAAALLAVLVLAAAGCGGDDDGDTAAGGQTTAPAAAGVGEARGDNTSGGKSGGSAPEIAYSGDVEQARAGGTSVDVVYDNFAAAVDDGISATDVAVRDTLDTGRQREPDAGLRSDV